MTTNAERTSDTQPGHRIDCNVPRFDSDESNSRHNINYCIYLLFFVGDIVAVNNTFDSLNVQDRRVLCNEGHFILTILT